MMIRRVSGWYADATVSGHYAVLVRDSHLETDTGRIELPQGENVLQLRVLDFDGRRWIAGAGHQSGQAWLHTGDLWRPLGPTFGLHACVFDPRGDVLMCRGGLDSEMKTWERYGLLSGASRTFTQATGAQGIRWVRPDGTIITADASYADPARGLWEYTSFGDLTIGQGAESGCVVRFADDGRLRLVEPGHTRFVRVDRAGEQFSVALVRQDTREAVIVWLTWDDLHALPVVERWPPAKPVTEPPRLPRPLWLGDYKAVGRDGDFATEALEAANLLCVLQSGDCDPDAVPTPAAICLRAAQTCRAAGARMAIGWQSDAILTLREDWDVVACIIVSPEATGSHPQDLRVVEQQAASAGATMQGLGLPLRPILCYIDATITAPFRMPTGVSWMAVRGYLGPTSPASGVDAVRQLSVLLDQQLAVLPVDVPVILIAQSYDRNGVWLNINALMDMQPVYAEHARRDPRIVGIFRFAYARAGGIRTYPQLREWHRAMWRANPGRPAPVPTPTPLPVPSPPPVEVCVTPTYQQFLYDWPSALTTEYQRVNGRDPALSDVMHGLWGILYEGQPVPKEPSPLPPSPSPLPPSPSPPSRIGASYYTSLTDPRCDPVAFATRLQDAGCSFTRVWLIDAWAVGVNGIGQYEGFVPWERDAGIFDLERVSGAYLDRLSLYVDAMNAHGITPQLSGLELYSWSDRKAGMLWVPDANLGPFRRNRQGLRYADDSAFTNIATGGRHQFLEQCYTAVVKMLDGLRFLVEIGNELPEKPLHYRLRDAWRRAGYVGPISVNRQDDTPGQYVNMKIGQEFEDIAYHGKKTWAYLDEDFPREPTFRTFRQFYASGPDFSRITLSSDGARKTTNVEDAYDYAGLRDVARDSMARGGQYEHQLALKLRGFTHGRIDLDDIQYDLPLLKSLQR